MPNNNETMKKQDGEELPPLVSGSDSDEETDGEPPALLDDDETDDGHLETEDDEESDAPPPLVDDDEEEDDEEDGPPPLLSDEGSNAMSSDEGSEGPPDLISDNSDDDDEEDDEDRWQAPGMRAGFFNKQGAPRPAQPYGQRGVGHKEQVLRPKAAPSASGQQAPTGATASTKKARPKAEATQPDQAPKMASLSELNRIQEERQREREALRGKMDFLPKERAQGDGCLGRCCLRPGSLGWGGKWNCDKHAFKVKETDRRLQMSCSHGCALLFHYPSCWRNFKEGYRATTGEEVEDVLLRGKKKMIPFPCHTDGCGGYIQHAILLEGPRGEAFKQKNYDIPPELEEQLQAAKQKKREEQVACCSKRKPTEQEVQEAALLAGKEAAKKQLNKKKMRKDNGAGTQGDKPEGQQQAGAAAAGQAVEGWMEVGGLSRGLRKEAAREARDRTKDATAREAAAAGLKAAKDAQAQGPAAGPSAASASGGIKITRRAQPEQQTTQMDLGSEAASPSPELLIPDDKMLKPLHKVAEEEEEEAECRCVQAASSRAHKEQQEQQEQQERAGAESEKAVAKQAANAKAQQALQRKKKKAMKVDLGSLLQDTGATGGETISSAEASSSTKPKGKRFVPHQGAAVPPQGAAVRQAQTTFSMSNFPTLEDAITAPRNGKEKEEVILMDDMLEALRQLKISINEIHFTQHLLIECLDIRSILEIGQRVEDVVTGLCADAGAEVIQMEVFERQDAVAITTANVEQAQHCMVQLQLQQVYRRKIQLCFLEDFPSHALLNQLMMDLRATHQVHSDLTAANFPSLRGSEAASTSRPVPSSLPSHPSRHRAAPIFDTTEPPPPPPPRGSLTASARESAARVEGNLPSLNPTAPAFAPMSSSAAGASQGRLTPSCSSASSQVGWSDAGASTTASAAARNGTAAQHLQQQRQQQQQQQTQHPAPVVSVEQQEASARVSADRAGPTTAAAVTGDEEDAALQLALEMSKQDTHVREEEDLWAEQAELAISSAPMPESPAPANNEPVLEPPATAPAVAANVASAHGSPPPVAPPAMPSSASTQAVEDIVRRYDALHFSITNTQVLGHYRAYTQFQLPAGFFRDPHLVNGQERCGLALFNIDSQTLEGLWEATFYHTATQNVIFRKVEDSPPLPIHQAKALLDQGGVPLVLNPSSHASQDTQYSLPSQSKLSGPLTSDVVRMMLLSAQARAPPVSTSRTPEVPLPPPTAISPLPQARTAPPALSPPPSLSLLHAASPPPRAAAASPIPSQQPPQAPAPFAPSAAQAEPPPSQPSLAAGMPLMSPDAHLQSTLASALATRGAAPAPAATAFAAVCPSASPPRHVGAAVPVGPNPPPTQPRAPRPSGIPFLPPALAHLMSARMGFGSRPLQQPPAQQAPQQQPQQQQPISTTAVRPTPAASSPPPFSSPSPPAAAPAASGAAASPPLPPAVPAAAPSVTLPAAPPSTASPPPSSSSPAPAAAVPAAPIDQPTPHQPPGPTSAATLSTPPQPPPVPADAARVAGALPPAAARASPPLQAGGSPKPSTAPAAPGGTKPTSIQARLMCVMCGTRRATWFNMVCKHMGPCEVCLPQGEAAYKECFKCGGGTKLHRVF